MPGKHSKNLDLFVLSSVRYVYNIHECSETSLWFNWANQID